MTLARVSTRKTGPISAESVGKVSPVAFLQETVAELRKSVWPSREETTRLTMVVIALAIAAGFFLGGLDRILTELFTRVIL